MLSCQNTNETGERNVSTIDRPHCYNTQAYLQHPSPLVPQDLVADVMEISKIKLAPFQQLPGRFRPLSPQWRLYVS